MSIQRKPYLGDLLPLVRQGKVRDTYAIPWHDGRLLMVATDVVSTHNVPHKSMVPCKGEVLTAMTHFWSQKTIFSNHILAVGRKIYDFLPTKQYPEDLHLRAMVVSKLEMIPVEFIFRARMAGSLWKSYSAGKSNPYGLKLPAELQLMSLFDSPIFTPTDKSEMDEPLQSAEVSRWYITARYIALTLYEEGVEYAREKGIEIIDAKFELGRAKGGELFLGDEFLNPDCCRFVRADKIVVGQEPPWMDKEILRQEAMRRWGDGPKTPLNFSSEVVKATTNAYMGIFERLTGMPLSQYQQKHFG